MSPHGWKVSNTLLGKSAEIVPERMKQLAQRGNNVVMDVSGGESKVWCYKEQCCMGTWNIRSMNQGKLEVVKRDGKSEHRHFRNQ